MLFISMLYSEFLSLTEGIATNEQFVEIEAIYMNKETMTKLQAVRLWKRRYMDKVSKFRSPWLAAARGDFLANKKRTKKGLPFYSP